MRTAAGYFAGDGRYKGYPYRLPEGIIALLANATIPPAGTVRVTAIGLFIEQRPNGNDTQK